VANKSDLPEPAVSPEEGQALADELRMSFSVASAKADDGVDELFAAVAHSVLP